MLCSSDSFPGHPFRGFVARAPGFHGVEESKKVTSPRKKVGMKPFQFTVYRDENGYRVRVKQGEDEFVWTEVFSTLEKAGQKIWEALTNASQSRGEI